MITDEISFQIKAQDNNTFWMIKFFCQKWLVKKSKFVWRKKTHPEHKYSITFVSKVGTTLNGNFLMGVYTKIKTVQPEILFAINVSQF